MQYKCFKIPLCNPSEFEGDLNKFLLSHRIIKVDKQFFSDNESSQWIFCIEYQERNNVPDKNNVKKSKIDYKDILSEVDFEKFAKLREWRKDKSQKIGVPLYAIFHNEHLAEIAKLKELTKVSIASINGIGEEKTDKYFEEVLSILEL